MIKKWRKQLVYKEINPRKKKPADLSKLKVADLWVYASKRLDELSFSSSDPEKSHQVSPLDFSLSIPDKQFLNGFDESTAKLALMGLKIEKEFIDKNISTIYHELFHVLQVSYTGTVFDYFYLIDDLQNQRKNLLKFLKDLNFFEAASNEAIAYTQSVFHYVEIYGKQLTQHLNNLVEEDISSRAKEIDFELNLILDNLNEREKILAIESAEKHKASYSDQIKLMFHEKIKEVDEMEKSLSNLADLSRAHIEEIIEYLNSPGDLEIHTFHLIEGSAEMFGLCCGGYNASVYLDQRINDPTLANDTYVKAYQLFRDNEGKTPIVFIIFTLFCLKYGSPKNKGDKTPADIFTWGLARIKNWEQGLNEKISSSSFEFIIDYLTEKIGNSIKSGFFINSDSISVYDKNETIKESEKSIFSIRLSNVRSNFRNEKEFSFLSEIIINNDTARKIIESFKNNEKLICDLRKNQVFRDYEKILLNPDLDFSIMCCAKHGDLERFDETIPLCPNDDSFIKILENYYKLDVSQFF